MALNPFPSKLDQTQIMQRSFDGDNDRLRVDATVTASIGTVVVNADTSDIAIKDRVSGYLLKINSDGSLDVNTAIAAASDNILVLGTNDGTLSGTQNVFRVDSQGIQSTFSMNMLVQVKFDSIYPTYPDTVTEIYTYKQSGSTVAVVTVIYTDASKNNLVSVIRT